GSSGGLIAVLGIGRLFEDEEYFCKEQEGNREFLTVSSSLLSELWSPSRIIKDFLVYRELSTRDRNIKRHEPIDEVLQARIEAEGLKVHQCSKGTFILRNNGLLKKTISIKFNGSYQHMIIYEDNRGREESLLPPKAFEELRYIQPSEDIIKSEKMPKIIRNSARKKSHIISNSSNNNNHTITPYLWNHNNHENEFGDRNFDYNSDNSDDDTVKNSLFPSCSLQTISNIYNHHNSNQFSSLFNGRNNLCQQYSSSSNNLPIPNTAINPPLLPLLTLPTH
ncbi:8398_t:CDS:2, partial [Entrophospora sp. SA101]